MTKNKQIKVEKIFASLIDNIVIHEIAKMNPLHSEEDFVALKYSIKQIGQQEPVILFKGKMIDGVNRLRALKELRAEASNEERYKYEKITYKNLAGTLSMEEIEAIVIGKETRRHKTPTQKAIQAMNYYIKKTSEQTNINMKEAGKIFGISSAQISRAIICRKFAGEAVVQHLFMGKKIPIKKAKRDGTIYETQSDSLDAISKYYRNLTEPQDTNEATLDAIEMSYAQLKATELIDDLSGAGITYIVSILEKTKDASKLGCSKKKMIETMELLESQKNNS